MKYLFTFQREVDKTAIIVERQYIEATSEKEARELVNRDDWEHYRIAQDLEYFGGDAIGWDYEVDLIRAVPLKSDMYILDDEKYL